MILISISPTWKIVFTSDRSLLLHRLRTCLLPDSQGPVLWWLYLLWLVEEGKQQVWKEREYFLKELFSQSQKNTFRAATDFLISCTDVEGSSNKSASLSETLRVAISHRAASGEDKIVTEVCRMLGERQLNNWRQQHLHRVYYWNVIEKRKPDSRQEVRPLRAQAQWSEHEKNKLKSHSTEQDENARAVDNFQYFYDLLVVLEHVCVFSACYRLPHMTV